MKKVVRLTEEDLNRLVNKILKEQTSPTQNEPMNAVQQCFTESGVELKNYPNCLKLVNETIGGKTPQPQTLSACVGEVAKDILVLGTKALTIAGCVSGKLSSKKPVAY